MQSWMLSLRSPYVFTSFSVEQNWYGFACRMETNRLFDFHMLFWSLLEFYSTNAYGKNEQKFTLQRFY